MLERTEKVSNAHLERFLQRRMRVTGMGLEGPAPTVLWRNGAAPPSTQMQLTGSIFTESLYCSSDLESRSHASMRVLSYG